MPVQELDPTGAKILDGAVRVLGDFGFKRATVELVAKYAGVSHMTIYRRWPSKNDLLKTAVIGEFTTLLDAGFSSMVGDTDGVNTTSFAEVTLAAFSDIVWAVQNHPLVLRELNSDAGEQSPLLSSTSSAVMEATVPLVAERLRHLAGTTDDAPARLDSVADVFVRLAHSLVVVKRPDQPLTTRAEVANYARECFGPYLQALAGLASGPVSTASVVELDQRRSSRNWHRPHLQIAAASLFGVLTLGAGLTAVLNGAITLPFIAPAGISKTTGPANTSPVPGQEGPRATAEPQLPAPAAQPPSPVAPPSVVQPVAEPATIPQIEITQRATSEVGSVGGNSANDDLPAGRPVATPLAPRPPSPAPGPRPPGPGPQPPGPKPPSPQPPGPGPKPPGPKPPAPGPQQPGPKPPGPGSQQPGPKPPGPGPQANQQSGPPN